jgi:hypothetical protein
METKRTLTDTVELRAARIRAYRANQYAFSVPPVHTGGWDEEAWCNWVVFQDAALTGFLPYDSALHSAAQIQAAKGK